MKMVMFSYQYILSNPIIKDIGMLNDYPNIEEFYEEIYDYVKNYISTYYQDIKTFWLVKKRNIYFIHTLNYEDIERPIGEIYITKNEIEQLLNEELL